MDGSSRTGYDSNERVDLPSRCFKCLYEWSVFSGLFVVGDVGKFGKFVVAVGEVYVLYDVWWGWGGATINEGT